jgi:deoxyribonuclease (pyrimidine dimer)
MVRINLVRPVALSDQHIIAEYNEILMLIGHVKKYPKIYSAPPEYKLGEGHINFFKDKVGYLKCRHDLIKKEMSKRGFKTNKTIKLSEFKKEQKLDWRPRAQDLEVIKKRIITKIKLKPDYYRYYREKKKPKFFIDLLN